MPKERETILTAAQLAEAEIVPAYRHPASNRTVARHLGGEAYTITGLPCGPADAAAAEAARAATGDGSGEALPPASQEEKTAEDQKPSEDTKPAEDKKSAEDKKPAKRKKT